MSGRIFPRFCGGLAAWLLAWGTAGGGEAGQAVISVHPERVEGRVSRYLTGACIEDVNHEIYGGLYSQMIFGESFQEPAPSAPIPHFRSFGGDWQARGGELTARAGDGPKLVAEGEDFGDGGVGAEVFFADRSDGNAGLVAHLSQAGVGADRFTGYEISLDPGRQIVRLARHRDNYELIKDVPCEIPTGSWVSLEVRFTGTRIDVLVRGLCVLQQEEGAQALPAGAPGLRVWQREARYRDFFVSRAGATARVSFSQPEGVSQVSGMWRAVRRGEARGHAELLTERPFTGVQAQELVFEGGTGEWGVENQGLNRWGLSFEAGRVYEGEVWARAAQPVTVAAAMESRDGSRVYAETPFEVKGGEWQRLDFTLTPSAADRAGRFALKLTRPGSVVLGYAALQPGGWGRFKGLPVRRDVTEALIAQGITVLRYGGSMVNHPEYRWKKMTGPRDRRPPNAGMWYRRSSNGWGIPDFMDFCEAAGFEYVPDFNLDETPADMADFVEYARGAADRGWGAKRAADGHSVPYRLRYLELGNEERVDESYFARFKRMAEAIWARDPDLILVVGDFFYHRAITDPFNFEGGAVKSLAAHQKILELAKAHGREVWFDIHVDTEAPPAPGDLAGPRSFIDQLAKLCPGAKYQVVIFELNAGNHRQKRAISNALAINAVLRDGRFPITTSANCLQPDGQNDNGWDQGLLFLSPSQVWFQPPGYVTRMFSANYQPLRLGCEVTAGGTHLDVTATRSEDGKTVVLQVVNPEVTPASAAIGLGGFRPTRPTARVEELQGDWEARNTAEHPEAITPTTAEWPHGMVEGRAVRVFPPRSFSVMRFD